jgi:hypothetical protein
VTCTYGACKLDEARKLTVLGLEADSHRSVARQMRATPYRKMEEGMAMTIVETRAVIGGVDTHLDTHVTAALDGIGGLLTVQQFPATLPGYQALLGWLGGFGAIDRVGVEGTGSTEPADSPPVSRRRAGRRDRPGATGRPDAGKASPMWPMPSAQPGPPSPALPAEHEGPRRRGRAIRTLLAAKPSARWRAHSHNRMRALGGNPDPKTCEPASPATPPQR